MSSSIDPTSAAKANASRGLWRLDTAASTHIASGSKEEAGHQRLASNRHLQFQAPARDAPNIEAIASAGATASSSSSASSIGSSSTSHCLKSSLSTPSPPSPPHSQASPPITPPDSAPGWSALHSSSASSRKPMSPFSSQPGRLQQKNPKISEGSTESSSSPLRRPTQSPAHHPSLPHGADSFRPSPTKSRNDIFAAAPTLTPPKPPPPVGSIRSPLVSPREVRSPSSSMSPSQVVAPSVPRNSLFFDSPATSPGFAVFRGGWLANQDGSRYPPPASSSAAQRFDPPSGPGPSSPIHASAHSDFSVSRRPIIVDHDHERLRIRQDESVEFRLAPTREYLLGEGRHSSVYLGSYRRKSKPDVLSNDDVVVAHPMGENESGDDWQLCAIKRLHADRAAQILGLEEAFALRRLGPHPGVVELIDIRDEVLASTSPLPTPQMSTEATNGVPASVGLQAALGIGSPPSSLASRMSSVALGRSMSVSRNDGEKRAQKASQRAGSHLARIVSQPDPNAIVDTQVNNTEGLSGPGAEVRAHNAAVSATPSLAEAASTLSAPTAAQTGDPPRLLILLELLPFSLASYIKRRSSFVDLFFWLRCAAELAETVAWMHSKSCVHADIKPENILLDHSLRTKLCDFNSCIFMSNMAVPLEDGLGLGTPAYGAPELTKRGQGAKISYPIDIFSLGAVFYSLATGVEPMSRSRSVIDMMQRKERFFTTEENDRIARVSLAEGRSGSTSNLSSAYPSRQSSMRRSKKAASPNRSRTSLPRLRRETSKESFQSTASSITNIGGRIPSLSSIRLLLDPSPIDGLLLPPAQEKLREGSVHKSLSNGKQKQLFGGGHSRAASLNKKPETAARPLGIDADVGPQQGSASAAAAGADFLEANGNGLLRPFTLRRISSYNDGQQVNTDGGGPPRGSSTLFATPLSPIDGAGSPPAPGSAFPKIDTVVPSSTLGTSLGEDESSKDHHRWSEASDLSVSSETSEMADSNLRAALSRSFAETSRQRTLLAQRSEGAQAQGGQSILSDSIEDSLQRRQDSGETVDSSQNHGSSSQGAHSRQSSSNHPFSSGSPTSFFGSPRSSLDGSGLNRQLSSSSSHHRGKNARDSLDSSSLGGAHTSSTFSDDGREDHDEGGDDDEGDATVQLDLRPYRDGSPALLLPGGGRLPQAALDLIEEMVSSNPARRPTAREVWRRVRAIEEEVVNSLV